MKFTLKKYQVQYQVEDSSILIESRGKERFCVIEGDRVYNKFGEWEIEPKQSLRTKEFIRRTRFTWEEACQKANQYFESLP